MEQQQQLPEEDSRRRLEANLLLNLPEPERRALGRQIDEDVENAYQSHSRRMERFVDLYRRWRNRVEAPAAGDEDKPNFSVPLVQWQTFGKWAQIMQSLFGDDAEVISKPTGPSDHRAVSKVGRYMTYRVFSYMNAITDLAVFCFRAIVFGKSHVFRPWRKKSFDTPQGRETYYDGPCLEPLWPDDFLVPAEDAKTVQDYSWCLRKFRATPQDLLDGERDGVYEHITDNIQQIFAFADGSREREAQGDEVKEEKDEAEGVTYQGAGTGSGSLVAYEWYGKWRMLRGGHTTDVEKRDLKRRELNETDIVVRYLPDLQLVIGAARLMDLYPRMRNRRPFGEMSLVHDGSTWPAGFGELLRDIEDEVTVNHRLFTAAGQFGVGPLIFAAPDVGAELTSKSFRYEPNTVLWTANPAGINVVRMQPDLQYALAKEQGTLAYGERVTGVSDQSLGRAIDRPNAPRTAAGQIALIEQGNVRAFLDTLFIREDLRVLLTDIWDLERNFATDQTFFRVTEEEANGAFAVVRGGAAMTAAEFNAHYDFDIKFATSVWSREARDQKTLARYQLDIQNPLIIQNPRALWRVTNDVHRALGDPNFSELVPEPPDMGLPKQPREEWTLILQGEEIHPNPLDNDDLHLMDHYARIAMARKSTTDYDPDAVNGMIAHIIEHDQQKREKQMMMAMAQSLTRNMQASMDNPALGGMVPGQAMPLAGVQSVLQNLGVPQQPQPQPQQGTPAHG